MSWKWLHWEPGCDVIVVPEDSGPVAYANPTCGLAAGPGDHFIGTCSPPATLKGSSQVTPDEWERAIGLVICGIAERVQT